MNKTSQAKIARHLAATDRQMAALIRKIGKLDFKPSPARSPFESLVRAVAHQQLHSKAAGNILDRFEALFPGDLFPTPEQVLRKRAATLSKVGFSGSKVQAIRDIAAKTLSGIVPSAGEILTLSDDEIIERLVQVRGVGRWTAEMLLIFQLGRPDVFPADDFGVKSGFIATFAPNTIPKPKEFRAHAERWQPFRTYAALYFWRAADSVKSKA